MKKKVTTLFVLLGLFFLTITSGLAEESLIPDPHNASKNRLTDKETESIHSMGLAPNWEFYLGPSLVFDREGSGTDLGGNVNGGILRYLGNPNLGLGLAGEGYLGVVESDVDPGLRLLGVVKFPFLQAGIDHSFRIHETDFILSLVFPVKRGGLFGLGDSVRVDWLPGRDNSFSFGFRVPIGNRYRGKTRNKNDQVHLPVASMSADETQPSPNPKLEIVLDHIRHSAAWIKIYTTPFFDQKLSKNEDDLSDFRKKVMDIKAHINLMDAQYPRGHTYYAEVLAYHRALLQAFTIALNVDKDSVSGRMEAERIANEVRKILLEEVIIPYNLNFGRSKRNDSLLGYGDLALRRLIKWMNQETGLSRLQHQLAAHIFKTLIKMLDDIRQGSKSVWQDSKLVWIPLHYGLEPHEYDSQAEMDAIIEKATGDEFVNGNEVYYVINEQFQPEVARMILEAEDYHVLWIHDYRGKTPADNPDRIGFAQTLFGYLSAMTSRVKAYDDTGKFPVYIILIDQFYYEANEGRLWLSLLQNPLNHELQLPTGYKQWEAQIRQAQRNLRIAVEQSNRLQQQAAAFGPDWLADKIKVHVNVTNPSDFSFRSAHLIDNMPITPDNLTRDHRKVSFYDVTEADPGKGEAIYSGLGIGEHYSGPTWEDRSLLVRGPVLVSLKDAVRQVLLQQGFEENEIPPPLHKLPRPKNYAEMIKSLTAKGWDARVMDIHNQTGFYPKPLNALKAALYNLMPPGATIIVPDSLWNSPFWGGMLAGAALRGCRVLVIAPALANAPSAGFPQMSRAHELFMRLVIVQNELRDEIGEAGGMLKVGIFTRSSDVGDLPAKLKEFAEGVRQHPFIKDIFPFRPEVYRLVETYHFEQPGTEFQPTYYTQDVEARRPKLHLKTNFFASKEMQKILAWEGWQDVLRYYLQYRAALTAREEIYVDVRDVPEELEEAASILIDSYWDALPEEEKQQVMYYLMVGSQNQDYRGMIMDGEVAAVVSGEYSLVGLMDLFFTTGLTTWVEDISKLDELLPPESGWKRWLGRYIMKAL